MTKEIKYVGQWCFKIIEVKPYSFYVEVLELGKSSDDFQTLGAEHHMGLFECYVAILDFLEKATIVGRHL